MTPQAGQRWRRVVGSRIEWRTVTGTSATLVFYRTGTPPRQSARQSAQQACTIEEWRVWAERATLEGQG